MGITESISTFFCGLFGTNSWLATFLIAIIPLIELKGAIPFGISTEFWGENALSPMMAMLFAFLGSSLVCPILALIFKPICNWLSKYKFFASIINFFTGSAKEKSEEVNSKIQNENDKKKTIIKMLEVFLFVAFPVPLTGVWTGTCLSVLMGLKYWQTCLAVVLGNLLCGFVVALVCIAFPGSEMIIIYIFLGIVLLAVLAKIISHIIKKNKSKKEQAK